MADPDAELMLRFQRGDVAAYEELVRRYQGRVVSLAARYLGSATDAEDLAQEVFLRVFRAKERYEPSAKWSTWVYRITVNASLNYLRGRKVRKKVQGPMPTAPDDSEADPGFQDPDAASPHEELEKQELADVLRGIIEKLPDRQRIAILLNKYQGLSYEETAKSMDLTLMAVKSLLTRARWNIKEKLAPYLAEGRKSD